MTAKKAYLYRAIPTIHVSSFKISQLFNFVALTSLLVSSLIFYASISQAKEVSNYRLTLEEQQGPERYFYRPNIIVEVNHFQQLIKIFRWLDQINLTPIGQQTLRAIETSGNELTIFHDDYALYSAGATGAPMTKNLTNGVGEDVYIRFYLDMDAKGSNCVHGKNGNYIDYSAIHNLFHELSHARHKMNGTWLYHDSEGQAIREENKFRRQWSQYRYEDYALRNESIADEEVTPRQGNRCHFSG